MANLGKLYSVKIRVNNAFYETILPEPMLADVELHGLRSSVIQHIQLTPAKYVSIAQYTTPVEIVDSEECHFEPHHATSAEGTGQQAMEVEVCDYFKYSLCIEIK